MTNATESLDKERGWTKRLPLGASDFRAVLYPTGHLVHPGKCILQFTDTREILTGHKAKFLGHRTRRKEKLHLVFTERTHS